MAVCELTDYLLVRRPAVQAFPPKLGWRLLRWFGIAACVAAIWGRVHGIVARPNSWPLWVYILLLLFWVFWPRSVLVDSSGISSCSLFGILRRSILWAQTSRIACDWQEENLNVNFFQTIWTFMGTRITVTSRDGIRIQHGVVNQKQGIFLDALRRHLSPEVFDPGLYDWHP
ncbi:MAG TPA: hypothetical protein VGR81_05150 [Candidatus Acidoferrales bacterium]|nr:hypothetical protein [Candidatus Acidoferrales bacterium]